MNKNITYASLENALTESRLEVQALKDASVSYQNIFERSQDAILILKNRAFVDCNQSAMTMLGYGSKQQFKDARPSDLSPPVQPDGRPSFEKAQEMMNTAVDKGSHRFEWMHRKLDGTLFPVEVLLTTISAEPGNELIYTIWRDISEHKKTKKTLEFTEKRFQSIVETTSDFIWEVNEKGVYTYASPGVKEMLGYDPEEIIGKTPFDLMPEKEKKRVSGAFQTLAANQEPVVNLENINLHKDGREVVLETSGLPFFNEKGELAGYRGIDRDVTNRKLYEEQLILTESVFKNSIEGIAITDIKGNIQKVNHAFTQITGYESQEVIGKNPRVLKSDRHDDDFYEEMWDQLVTTGQWSGEIWNRKKDGSVYPEWLSISSIRDEKGGITNFISVFHDISEKKLNEEKLEFLAFHDPLTHLPNRRLFYDRLNVAIETGKRTGKKMALLCMDIDNFKDINDTYGHPFGDEFLCQVKDRIASICRKSDTFARYGGDEFVIILNGLDKEGESVDFADRLTLLFDDPIRVYEDDVFTSLSIGLALFPRDGEDIVTLEKNADMALYKAKKEGKNRTYRFQNELKERILKRNEIQHNLQRAIKDFSSFSLMYQPKVDVKNNTIHGVEALVRWQCDGSFIPPFEFIPIAEETQLIVPLGNWIMCQAMTDMKKIHDSGYSDISLSINLSARQFLDEGLFNKIRANIEKTGFDQSKLIFEITESTSMQDIELSEQIMNQFRKMGFHLSVDDFGTGYSSLSSLKKFPLKELKIDRSFICDVPQDANDVAICKTIINMAHSLNYEVIAEGVENQAQLDFLKENGCHVIQGYYLYRPLFFQDLEHEINAFYADQREHSV